MFAIGMGGFDEGDFLEANCSTGAKLADAVEVGVNDLGDFGVAADGLAIDAQEDALAIAGHLDGAWADRFGDHFAGGQGQGFSLQAKAHAVAGGADLERLVEKFRLVKPVRLQSRHDPKRRSHFEKIPKRRAMPVKARVFRGIGPCLYRHGSPSNGAGWAGKAR